MRLKIEYEKCEGPILSHYVCGDDSMSLYVDHNLLDSRYSNNKDIVGLYPLTIMLNKYEQIMCFELTVGTIPYWKVRADLQVPEASYHRALFVENPIPSQQAKLWTTPDYALLFVETHHCSAKPTQAIRLTDKAILEFCEDGIVSGIWLLDLPEIIRQQKPSQGLYVFEMPTHTVKTLLQKEQRYQGLIDTYGFFLNDHARRDWQREKETNKQ